MSASVSLGTTEAVSLIGGRGASAGARASKAVLASPVATCCVCISPILLLVFTSALPSSYPSLQGTDSATSFNGAGASPVASGRTVSLVLSFGDPKYDCSTNPKSPMPSLLEPHSFGTVRSGSVTELLKSTSSFSTATADESADSEGNGASSISPNASDIDSTCPRPT